jgi:hypothetical protein
LNSIIVIILIAMALLVLAVIAFLIIRRQRREVDPPIQVETAMWSKAGQLDWCVKERQEWWGRVRGRDGRQRWIRAVDLCPASGSEPPAPGPHGRMTSRLSASPSRIGQLIRLTGWTPAELALVGHCIQQFVAQEMGHEPFQLRR